METSEHLRAYLDSVGYRDLFDSVGYRDDLHGDDTPESRAILCALCSEAFDYELDAVKTYAGDLGSQNDCTALCFCNYILQADDLSYRGYYNEYDAEDYTRDCCTPEERYAVTYLSERIEFGTNEERELIDVLRDFIDVKQLGIWLDRNNYDTLGQWGYLYDTDDLSPDLYSYEELIDKAVIHSPLTYEDFGITE